MTGRSGCAIAVVLFACCGGVSWAAGTDTRSVAGYGRANSACPAWTDGCTICRRDAAGEPRCSTPGIACTPRDLTCDAPASGHDEAAPP